MKITYNKDGAPQTLEFDQGKWTGSDPTIVELLNADPSFVVDGFRYYPTPWHMVKAVADALGGTLDTLEPSIPIEPGTIY